LNLSSDTKYVQDLKGKTLLLFSNTWGINWATDRNPGLELSEFSQN
jgi:peptide chain release factor 3